MNKKSRRLLLMINGETFGVEEILENGSHTEMKKNNARFFTIKARSGEKKLTIRLDSRLLNVLKNGISELYYIQ